MNDRSNSGVFTAQSLQHWSAILEHWCAIVEQHCEISGVGKFDVPWWNNEVSNAALLAAAVIQCGHAAFVEPRCLKGGCRGRLDLWVQFGRQTRAGQNEEYVELKIANYRGRFPANVYLNHAVEDAHIIDGNHRGRIGACVFKIVNPQEEDLVQPKIADDCAPDALAWAFPTCVREFREEDGSHVPGVVLAMKLSR